MVINKTVQKFSQIADFPLESLLFLTLGSTQSTSGSHAHPEGAASPSKAFHRSDVSPALLAD